MMRRILLFAFLLITLAPAWAQDIPKDATTQELPPAGKALTLPECVDIALKNNLRVRRGLFAVQTADVNLLQSKMNFLPNLNLGGSYAYNWGRSLNPVTNQYIVRNGNSINGQLTSSVLLFQGFRLQNTFRQSKKELEASNADLQKAKNDVIINVVTLYINVIFNKELLENNKLQLASSLQSLERITKQVDAGLVPKSNQLTQEAQVATNEVNLINQENALNLSILNLKQAMQVPAAESMDVVVPELELEQLVLEQSPSQIYDISLKTMPEIRGAVLRVESAQLALAAAKGSYYPRISLNGSAFTNYSSLSREIPTITGVTAAPSTGPPIGFIDAGGGLFVPVQGYSYTPIQGVPEKYTESEQLRDNLSKSLSLQVQIPIFNNWSTKSNVQRAAIQTEIARISEVEIQNTLRQTIESAYNDAYAASKTYTASTKQVNAREEAYRMVQQRFDLGSANFVEKQIAENDLFQSRSDLTRAKYNFIFRKKILDFYQGKQIEY